MKIFTLSPHYSIVCNSEKTRYGFRHIAVLMSNGHEVDRTKACYYNRTWESYEYQSVGHRLIERFFDKPTARRYKNKMDGIKRENPLRAVAAICAIGDILGGTQKETNEFKRRIIGTVPGIDIPADFDSLPEEEKQRRLDGVAKIAGGQ